MDVQPARLLRFGDFELDVRAGELRKQGVRIRLQDQSFQILLMLLEHPGEVVLREEIRQKLWPNNTIVEFDHSINAAIKRLRNALGETAEEPRYIETLAKRGYRFVGKVAEQPREEVKDQPKAEPDPANPIDTDALSGKTFSNYRVFEKLGTGGMGVVYRAEDLKLGRQVALKFLHLPAEELPDSLLDRFAREARAAAALNHPNICAVHSVDSFAGQPVIVMELVEGETLEARLARSPLMQKEAVALAIQISDALAEAHRKGIVHRDLKPANVMLTKSGVKVLDFGLAQLDPAMMERPLMAGDESIRQSGLVLGTVHYMSPEQAQGEETDARTDIFSFGVVLYEMVAGARPFQGETGASVIAAILEREPPPLTPEALGRVVRRCLAKDPDERWQSVSDLKTNLEWLEETAPFPPLLEGAPEPSGARLQWLGWIVAALASVGLATVAFLHFREIPLAPAAPIRFQIPPPENTRPGVLFSLSPDGRKLAFTTGDRLWVHSLESGESRDLTACKDATPFWSPDSRFIAYVAAPEKLKRIEATGGPSQTVTDYSGPWGGGAWNQDGLIVFSNRDAFFRVPSAGGVPAQITAVDRERQETIHYSPAFLPDGRHFLYTRRRSDDRKSAIYLGSVDATPAQQSSKPLVNSFWGPKYAPSADPGLGYMLFIREDTLMAQPFDNRRLELTGQATPVAEQIGDGRAFSASDNGVLVFQRTAQERQLTWNDREGRVLGFIGDPGDYRSLALSPDGTRAALGRGKFGQATNIWLVDLARGTGARFVFGSGSDTNPVWSPDGSRIVFSSNREGPSNLYQKHVSGERDEEILLQSNEDKFATSWSHDGRFLLYTVFHPKTNSDIWVLPLDRDRKPFPFLVTEFAEQSAQFSPDGHWVAYISDESGRFEIYVRSFAMNSSGTAVEAGGKWPISNGGGSQPRWRNDGRELYYQPLEGALMVAEIATSPVFQVGAPRSLGLAFQEERAAYVTDDGKRFLMLAPKSGKPEPYTVILNWQPGLKR